MPSLLCARNRLGRSVAEIVAADLNRDGPAVLDRLRTTDTAAWARLAFDLSRLREVIRAEASPKAPPGPRPA